MKKFSLIIMFSMLFPQYFTEWEVPQDAFEVGSLSFDINHDGVPELAKQWWNTETFYDGTDGYAILWYVVDESVEYLTLNELIDVDGNGIDEALFSGSRSYADTSVQVSLWPVGGDSPIWSTDTYPGYLTFIESNDFNNDSSPEIIFGVSRYHPADSTYTSTIYILNAADGRILWNSSSQPGFITGPFTGDLDADGQTEFLYNRYDYSGEDYSLNAWGAESDMCSVGDNNQDGEMDVLDIVQAVNCIMSGCTEDETACMDVNEDTVVDVLDIVEMVNTILTGDAAPSLICTEEWQLSQDAVESGNLFFDINRDGVSEITKHWWNTVTIYDGAQDYSVVWAVVDTAREYLTFLQLTDVDQDGNEEGIFLSSSIYADTSFYFSAYPVMGNAHIWTSSVYDGYLSWMETADTDNDGTEEIIFGVNRYLADEGSYQSTIHVLNGLTGDPEWSSSNLSGYIIGPFTGDLDGDGVKEILANLYDPVQELYSLIAYGYHVGSRRYDDEIPAFILHQSTGEKPGNFPSFQPSNSFQKLRGETKVR